MTLRLDVCISQKNFVALSATPIRHLKTLHSIRVFGALRFIYALQTVILTIAIRLGSKPLSFLL